MWEPREARGRHNEARRMAEKSGKTEEEDGAACRWARLTKEDRFEL
jgi:hypothetical protein